MPRQKIIGLSRESAVCTDNTELKLICELFGVPVRKDGIQADAEIDRRIRMSYLEGLWHELHVAVDV